MEPLEEQPPSAVNEAEYAQSELLRMSYDRASSILRRYDHQSEERRRDLQTEISDADSRRAKEATERRKSVINNTQPALTFEESLQHEGENVVNTLTSISLSEEFDVSDLIIEGVDASDLDRDLAVFHTMLDRAKQQDASRLQKMKDSLRAFKWQQEKMVQQSIHVFRQSCGFYKQRGRLTEMEAQLARSKSLLSEKRYALKLMQSDSTSVEELRLKYEAETEEAIRKLIGLINKQKAELERLTKRCEAIERDSDTLCKEIGQILFELEKEEKHKRLSLISQGGDTKAGVIFADDVDESEDQLFDVFPFLLGAVELTEEMVHDADKLRDETAARHALALAQHTALRESVEAKRAEYALLIKSDEFRGLQRLKKMVKGLEEKRNEDTERLALLEKLVKNADSITASMNAKKAASGFGILSSKNRLNSMRMRRSSDAKGAAGGGAGGAGGALHIRNGDDEEADDPDPRSQRERLLESLLAEKDQDDQSRYRSLQRKYHQAVTHAAGSNGLRSPRTHADPSSFSGSDGEGGGDGIGEVGEVAQVLPPTDVRRVITPAQVPSLELIRDQFEAISNIYRNSFGASAALLPFSEVPVHPFYQNQMHFTPRAASSKGSSDVPSPRKAPTSPNQRADSVTAKRRPVVADSTALTHSGSTSSAVQISAPALTAPAPQLPQPAQGPDATQLAPLAQGLLPRPEAAPAAAPSAIRDDATKPHTSRRPPGLPDLAITGETMGDESGGSPSSGRPKGTSFRQTMRDVKPRVHQPRPSPLAAPVDIGPVDLKNSRMTQAERTQMLEAQFDLEHFQTYGLKAAVQQLLGILSVLTHSAGGATDDQFEKGAVPADLVAPPAQDAVSLALLGPTVQAMAPGAPGKEALRSQEEEMEGVEQMHTQIHGLIAQVKDIYKQSHHVHHSYKQLLKEYGANAERYDKLKLQLFREVDGNKAIRLINFGDQQQQLGSLKARLTELRSSVQIWRQRVALRQACNARLAQFFQEGRHLRRREGEDSPGVSFSLGAAHGPGAQDKYTNERYRFSVMPQRMAVFEDINSLYERAIKDLHQTLGSELDEPAQPTATLPSPSTGRGSARSGHLVAFDAVAAQEG